MTTDRKITQNKIDFSVSTQALGVTGVGGAVGTSVGNGASGVVRGVVVLKSRASREKNANMGAKHAICRKEKTTNIRLISEPIRSRIPKE